MSIKDVLFNMVFISIPETLYCSCFTIALLGIFFNKKLLNKALLKDLALYTILPASLFMSLIHFVGLPLYLKLPINIILVTVFIIAGLNTSYKTKAVERYKNIIRKDNIDPFAVYRTESKHYIMTINDKMLGVAWVSFKHNKRVLAYTSIGILVYACVEISNILILQTLFNYTISATETNMLTKIILAVPTFIVAYFIVGMIYKYEDSKISV